MNSTSRFILFSTLALAWCSCKPGGSKHPQNGDHEPKLPQSKVAPELKPDNLIVGQVILRSPLPDPEKSNYDNCLYIAEVYVTRIEWGKPIRRSISVALPGFLKRTLTQEAKYKVGDLIRMTLSKAESIPESLKTMQRSDTLDNFSLDFFYALSAEKLERTTKNSSQQNSDHFLPKAGSGKNHPEISEKIAYPRNQKAAAIRTAAIQNDIQIIRNQLKSHGNDWTQWEQDLQPFFNDLKQKIKQSPKKELKDGNFYFSKQHDDAYKKICKKIDAGEPNPFTMLRGLSQQLRSRGIDLIVVPLPFKEDVHAGRFSDLAPDDNIFVPYRQKLLLHLLEADVEVIDLAPLLQKGHENFPFVFYDCPDAHPANGAIRISAQAVANRLIRYEFQSLPGYQAMKFTTKESDFEITRTDSGFIAGSRYPATVVNISEGGHILTNEKKQPAPVVIIGDSVSLVPMQLNGKASFPIHLSKDSGLITEQLLNLGGSSQAMHHLARAGGNFLADRWVMVFYFSPNRLMGKKSSMGDKGAWDLIDLPPLMFE